MYKLLFTLLNFCFIPLAFAKVIVIGGHFDKPQTKSVSIQFYSSALNYIERKATIMDAEIGPDNNFAFTIETTGPINFHLINGDQWLFKNKYAAPGDSLWFEFKKQTYVSGNCEYCVEFMLDWEQKFLNGTEVNKEFNSSFARLEPKEFKEYWDKRRKAQLDFLITFFEDKPVPKTFLQFMQDEINYDYAISLLQYSWRKESAKYILYDTNYVKFLDNIVKDNPRAINSPKYLQFLKELPYSLFLSEANNENGIYIYRNEVHIRDSIAKVYLKGKTYDLALYQVLFDQLGLLESLKGKSSYDFDLNYKIIDSSLSLHRSGFNDKKYYDRLRNKLNNLKDFPKEAPGFNLKDINGKDVNLSDFKGKVVYLGFWSGNSPNSLADIANTNKLMRQFRDKNIIFLFISFENSRLKWKKSITDNSFKGIHLNAPMGYTSEVANSYEISSVPQYFLIDKNGMLIGENAPRPGSNPEELIERALK